MLPRLLIAVVAVCSGPTPQEQLINREMASMNPMRKAINDMVMGCQPAGTRIDISIDLSGYQYLGGDGIPPFQAYAMKNWKAAWRKGNPGKHATLTVRFLDYTGKPFFSESAKV